MGERRGEVYRLGSNSTEAKLPPTRIKRSTRIRQMTKPIVDAVAIAM